MGSLIVIGLLIWGSYWAYRVGKQCGSRLGFNAGRHRRFPHSR
jgi:hypothetical protein